MNTPASSSGSVSWCCSQEPPRAFAVPGPLLFQARSAGRGSKKWCFLAPQRQWRIQACSHDLPCMRPSLLTCLIQTTHLSPVTSSYVLSLSHIVPPELRSVTSPSFQGGTVLPLPAAMSSQTFVVGTVIGMHYSLSIYSLSITNIEKEKHPRSHPHVVVSSIVAGANVTTYLYNSM